MSQLINFNNYKVSKSSRGKAVPSSSYSDPREAMPYPVTVDYLFRTTLGILVKNNPGKTLFSIKEAAEQLTVGEEFIRRRIKSGVIKATYLGDKPFINIVELARIITEGV